ncbi:MAG TPA: hypothetical protein PLL55_11025 [Candidatus Aminicenantes bacterium]|nr:hypothetical protein [Candidatus Aminicenantes bacterium]
MMTVFPPDVRFSSRRNFPFQGVINSSFSGRISQIAATAVSKPGKPPVKRKKRPWRAKCRVVNPPAEENREDRPLATIPSGGRVLFSPNTDHRFESEKEIRRPNEKLIARGRGFHKSGMNVIGLANLDKERFPFVWERRDQSAIQRGAGLLVSVGFLWYKFLLDMIPEGKMSRRTDHGGLGRLCPGGRRKPR